MVAAAPYRPPIVRPLLQAADAAGRPVSRSGHMLYFFGRIVIAIGFYLLHPASMTLPPAP